MSKCKMMIKESKISLNRSLIPYSIPLKVAFTDNHIPSGNLNCLAIVSGSLTTGRYV